MHLLHAHTHTYRESKSPENDGSSDNSDCTEFDPDIDEPTREALLARREDGIITEWMDEQLVENACWETNKIIDNGTLKKNRMGYRAAVEVPDGGLWIDDIFEVKGDSNSIKHMCTGITRRPSKHENGYFIFSKGLLDNKDRSFVVDSQMINLLNEKTDVWIGGCNKDGSIDATNEYMIHCHEMVQFKECKENERVPVPIQFYERAEKNDNSWYVRFAYIDKDNNGIVQLYNDPNHLWNEKKDYIHFETDARLVFLKHDSIKYHQRLYREKGTEVQKLTPKYDAYAEYYERNGIDPNQKKN